jgi:hypothetical protein
LYRVALRRHHWKEVHQLPPPETQEILQRLAGTDYHSSQQRSGCLAGQKLSKLSYHEVVALAAKFIVKKNLVVKPKFVVESKFPVKTHLGTPHHFHNGVFAF